MTVVRLSNGGLFWPAAGLMDSKLS